MHFLPELINSNNAAQRHAADSPHMSPSSIYTDVTCWKKLSISVGSVIQCEEAMTCGQAALTATGRRSNNFRVIPLHLQLCG